MTVPRDAVVDTGLQQHVFVATGDRFEPRAVMLGLQLADRGSPQRAQGRRADRGGRRVPARPGRLRATGRQPRRADETARHAVDACNRSARGRDKARSPRPWTRTPVIGPPRTLRRTRSNGHGRTHHRMSVRHKWVVFGAMLVLALFAADSARKTPLDALPDLSDPQVIIYTEWMGRSPDLVEDQITYPLVRAPKYARRANGPRLLDVRHELHLCPLRRGHRHLLGADTRARAAGTGPAAPATRGISDARARCEWRGLGLSIRAEGQHRPDGSRRTARCRISRSARRSRPSPVWRKWRARRIRAPVPDRDRPGSAWLASG